MPSATEAIFTIHILKYMKSLSSLPHSYHFKKKNTARPTHFETKRMVVVVVVGSGRAVTGSSKKKG